MRTIILVILMSFSSTSLAQEYAFNRLIQYEENEKNAIHVYFNIDNPEYFLVLSDSTNYSSAILYDLKQNVLHNYNVKTLQEENGLIYSYQYIDSKQHRVPQTSFNTVYHTFTLKRDDKYYKFGNLNLYSDEAKNDLLLSADLVLRYTHEDLVPIFSTCCLLGKNQPLGKIDLGDNLVVVKAVITDLEGGMNTYTLYDDQVVEFSLNVPD